MKKILKEPLLHFLLLSFLFFIIFDFLNPAEPDNQVITISEGRVAQLTQRFEKVWQRPPTAEEVESLVRNYALDEIYNREARALGLDKNDSIVKKRMRQKMEFMLQDTIPQQPEAGELETFFAEHRDNYRVESRYSFEQVFISIDQEKKRVEQRLEEISKQIQSGQTPVGDNSLLPNALNSASESELTRQFGQQFSDMVQTLGEKGSTHSEWQGPVQSGLGLHYIKIIDVTPGSMPELTAVYDKVVNDWKYHASNKARTEFENQLLKRYKIQREDNKTGTAEFK